MSIGMHATEIAPGTVPDWIHLLPLGTFKGADGRGPYSTRDPAAIIAASMDKQAGFGKLPVDENHSTDLAGPKGQPSPAVGWITEMQQRPDGIWGKVDWSPTGRKLLMDRAYRGVSPVFTYETDGTVQRIQRAALTNTPNLSLTALNARGITMLLGQNVRSRTAVSTYQPTPEDQRVFALMGLNVNDLVRMKGKTNSARQTSALSAFELTVCHQMGLDPLDFAATKEASETGQEPTYGLSKAEQAACQKMDIRLRDYAVSKQSGNECPLFSALPPEAKALCESMKSDPRAFALWYVNDREPIRT